jgi:DNA-binding LytR/AlgR family response regulator
LTAYLCYDEFNKQAGFDKYPLCSLFNFTAKSAPMLQQNFIHPTAIPSNGSVARLFKTPDTSGKTRMIVKKGIGYIILRLEDIVLFYTENKITYVVDRENKKYIGEQNLSELESLLNKDLFFRANRQYLLNIDFIKSYKSYEKVKLQVDLNLPELNHLIIVSQETAPQFREWMNQA